MGVVHRDEHAASVIHNFSRATNVCCDYRQAGSESFNQRQPKGFRRCVWLTVDVRRAKKPRDI
jgi:hypothetical protein